MNTPLSLANETLLQLMTAPGRNARLWQESFVVGEAELWGQIREATVVERQGTFMASVQVDLYTDRNKTHIVTDSAVGIAGAPEQAIRIAVIRYFEGTLRAFRAISDPSLMVATPEILQASRVGDPQPSVWKMLTGAWLTTGPQDNELQAALTANSPLSLLREDILSFLTEGESGLHWLKILAVRRPDGVVIPECAFNNLPFAAGAEKLRAFDGWPPSSKMQSFRQFVVLVPQERSAAAAVVQTRSPSQNTPPPGSVSGMAVSLRSPGNG